MANLRVDKITSTETFEKTGSVQFDGSGDYLSSSTIISGTGFGINDFTVDFWIYPANANSGNYTGILNLKSSTASDRFQVAYHSSNIQVYTDTGSWRDTGFAPDISSWTHISFVRNYSSNTLKMYANGVEKWLVSNTRDYDEVFDEVWVGRHSGQSTYLNGFISNIRIVNGTALYTSNFKPSMRELEVVPGTVLLACQSKTDASLEKTGKTITVNGNAVASELTPGILTPIVKSGGGSAITGSVEFDGTGDYLSIANNTDFNFGTGDFTVECFIYVNKHLAGGTDVIVSTYQDSSNGWTLGIHGSSPTDKFYFGIAGDSSQLNSSVLYTNSWVHLAAARSGSTAKLFINGVEAASASNSTNQTSTSDLHIGTNVGGGSLSTEGFISNLRVVKGTALYTDDFIPPTRELKRVPGTVLLCCQDENSVTTEVIGKTITSNGDPAPSNFTPQVGDDRQVTFEGVTKINSDAYFYLPTGDTVTRESRSGRSRGLIVAGDNHNTIEYINIASTGDAQDFGDLSSATSYSSALSSSTRGVCAVSRTSPAGSNTNIIDYVTIASTGNSLDFGDRTVSLYDVAALSSSIRGLIGGGYGASNSNAIDYVTIASTGNANDFGDLTQARRSVAGLASPTRGCFAAGYQQPDTTTETNIIDYVTIASTGNAQDFGDLTFARWGTAPMASSTRGVFGGGIAPEALNVIDYITIASTGNANDFGDLVQKGTGRSTGISNSTRGVAAVYLTNYLNSWEYITIQSMGIAQDFGESVRNNSGLRGGCSDSHGGLG